MDEILHGLHDRFNDKHHEHVAHISTLAGDTQIIYDNHSWLT